MKKILSLFLIVLSVTANFFTVSDAEWVESSIQTSSGTEYNNISKPTETLKTNNYQDNVQPSKQAFENKQKNTDIQKQTESQSISPKKVTD
ncbi:MAG: hypothetical protein LUH05_05050 [Candidatus Gastranaerophilales bacterium]|nr:hypothetical protein [Candidatus Gastranaerophilales bacterium]